MKTLLFFIAVFILSVFVIINTNAQISVTGCTGTGNGTYTSLTNICGAFQNINAGTQTGANIKITITSDVTNEAGTYSLNAGAWTSLIINPSGSRLISGSVSGGPMINMNGADYVTIDGLNTGGNSLTLSNTSTSSVSSTSTIMFINDAANNTITNCTILGSATVTLATNGGNIFISTAMTSGNGNDNITISNCNLGPAGGNLPSKLIYGRGSTTNANIANSNISINNCNMYDFFLSSGCAAVYALAGNTDWSVANNRIYQTATRSFSAAGTLNGIYFSNAAYGNNIQITGNTIGYASPNGTGALTLDCNGNTAQFQGIFLSSMPTAANDCNINYNIISDISLTSSSATYTFYGIYNTSSASSNTININNNQVKNIQTTSTSGYIDGIHAGSAAVLNCNNNTIDNITRDVGGVLCGIQYYTPTTATFNGNSISNLITTSTTSTNGVYGIYSGNAAVNEYIIGNSIYKLISASTANQYIYCIACGIDASGQKIVQNNNIYNISGGGEGATMYGIYITKGSSTEISGNNISKFNGGQNVYGIYSYSSANTNNIFKNKIYDLSSAYSSASVVGFFLINAVTTYFYNNFISDLKATTATGGYAVVGVNINGGTYANIYFNTVFLNASSTGTSFGTSCLFSFTTPVVDLRNNIFVNLSSHGSSGYTVSFRSNGSNLSTYSSNSNYNCFYAGTPGTNNLIFYDGSNKYQTIAAYKSITGLSPRDAASFSENPPFVNVSSAPYDLHLQTDAYTQCENGGTRITFITDDYDGITRNLIKPDVGADEGNFTAAAVWLGTTSNAWNTATNWGNGTSAPSSDQNVLINKAGSYNPVISGSTIIAGLYIKETNSLTINTGQSFSVNGNLINYGTYTDNGGTLFLSGSSSQSVGGTGSTSINNLSVDNTNGISLSGNISVNGTLTLSNGILDLNHNNISLGTTGNLVETQTAYLNQSVMTAPYGIISATRTLNQPSGSDIAGLGIKITSGANLGSTTISRGVERKSDSKGNLAIARYYDITPSNNSGLNATVVFSYNYSELGGGIPEGNLTVFKSSDNGSTWIQINGTLNTTNKTMTVTGVNDFSMWTLGDKNAPLPVELSSFTVNVISRDVSLKWITAYENNNSGFEIQRQRLADDNKYSEWEPVAFIAGSGTKFTPTNYLYSDKKLNSGKYNYRLKQRDLNGISRYFAYNGVLEVSAPLKFNMTQNYPNPFNSASRIDLDLPIDCRVNITLYDMAGREIKTLFDGTKTKGFHTIQFDVPDLSSGFYFYRIIAASSETKYVVTRKMVLLK